MLDQSLRQENGIAWYKRKERMADAEQATFTHSEDLGIKQTKPNKKIYRSKDTYLDYIADQLIIKWTWLNLKGDTVFQRNVNNHQFYYNEKRIYLPRHFYS